LGRHLDRPGDLLRRPDAVRLFDFVGRRVNLNPVWIMFALFAFGYLFGFVGLLIAVPLASAIGVLTRFALQRYYGSFLYTANCARCG
jgi:hypothetical protein